MRIPHFFIVLLAWAALNWHRGETMLTAVEGLYKNGHVELLEMPVGVMEPRVLVTFVVAQHDEASKTCKPSGQMIRLGQFPGTRLTNEEDFKLAEWHGEPEFDE